MSPRWKFDLFIDGVWDKGEGGGEPIEVINPATEELIGVVPNASTKDAARAIEAARRAFDDGPWPWMKPAERARLLHLMADRLRSRADELRALVTAQTGSFGAIAEFVQGPGSIDLFDSNADVAMHFNWVEDAVPTAGPTGMGGSALFREPVGVVGAITPFNFPFFLNMIKTAPALAAGCTVVLKPHPWTPLDAFLIAQAADEAGLPPGVFNVVTGHREVGEELTTNLLVDMITMTGSTATGRQIMAAGAASMKRLHLELGGKSAQVVLDDAGEEYARSIGFGAVLNHCGQGCAIPTRLLLPHHLLDAYKEGLEAARAAVVIGDPTDPTTTLGPLIREQQRQRVESLVQSGIDAGAEVLCGARRPPELERGFFYEPTVLVGTNDMRVAQEEIFGPVLTVIPYSGSDQDAIRLANDSIYGLGGGVTARNTARAFNVARQIRSGMLGALAQSLTERPAGAVSRNGETQPKRAPEAMTRSISSIAISGFVTAFRLSSGTPSPRQARGIACPVRQAGTAAGRPSPGPRATPASARPATDNWPSFQATRRIAARRRPNARPFSATPCRRRSATRRGRQPSGRPRQAGPSQLALCPTRRLR